MFDYLDWRGDLTFGQSTLCPIDMLIFATLAYCPMEHLEGSCGVLSVLTDKLYATVPEDENDLEKLRRQLWHAVAASPRFAGVCLERFAAHFDAAAEKQFAAATFTLNPDTAIVAFRGTDATLVGWKEDFNLSFESPIPAQEEAIAYLNQTAQPEIYVCGHSKGGNLAVYAAAHCDEKVRNRITGIYSFDGPGLDDATSESAAYASIVPRIHSFVPESSIIGMLMDYHDDYTIVDSDGVSLWQHNPFLWHVKGAAFATKPQLTRSGLYTDRTLHDFMASCSPEDRHVLVDTVFSLINATGAQKLRDIPGGLLRNLPAVRAALKNVSPETREVLTKIAHLLAEAGGSNIDVLLGMMGKNDDEA